MDNLFSELEGLNKLINQKNNQKGLTIVFPYDFNLLNQPKTGRVMAELGMDETAFLHHIITALLSGIHYYFDGSSSRLIDIGGIVSFALMGLDEAGLEEIMMEVYKDQSTVEKVLLDLEDELIGIMSYFMKAFLPYPELGGSHFVDGIHIKGDSLYISFRGYVEQHIQLPAGR